VNAPATALKVALVEPAGTVTLAGAVSGPLVASGTASPPLPAAALSATVQVDDAFGANEVGLQESDVTVTEGVTTMAPPVAVIAIELPVGDAATGPFTAREIEPDVAVVATVTTATMPSEMAVAFMPLTMQV
jgi:hypothetical protein